MIALIVILLVSRSEALPAQQRPMRVEDLFTIHQVSEVSLSPDGREIAVVITRPAEGHLGGSLTDNRRADIWVVPVDSGVPRNLTDGGPEGRGYWNPVWSPDGNRLAALTTMYGREVGLAVVEKATARVTHLIKEAVNPWTSTDQSWPPRPIVWIDNSRLLCPTLPALEAGNSNPAWRPSQRIAVEGWRRQSRGLEPTASVLESGLSVDSPPRRVGRLLLVDALSGQKRPLLEGNVRHVILSPGARHAAVIVDFGARPPDPRKPIPYLNDAYGLLRTRLALVSRQPSPVVTWVEGLANPKAVPPHVPIPHSWSPDGVTLAVIAQAVGGRGESTLFFIDSRTGKSRRATAEGRQVEATAWSGSGVALAMAQSDSRGASHGEPARYDWWAVLGPSHRSSHNMTASLAAPPGRLFTAPDPDLVLGMADGALWSIDVRTGRTTPLTDKRSALQEVLLSDSSLELPYPERKLLVLKSREGGLYRLEVSRAFARLTPLPHPAGEVRVGALDYRRHVLVMSGSDHRGTHIYVGGDSGTMTTRLTLDEHVSRIADPSRRLIKYQGIDGDSMNALLVLPVGYVPGRRYPLVAWVYGGIEISDSGYEGRLSKTTVSPLNLGLIPAKGYALLIPSIPLTPEGTPGDPYLDIPKGVLGAVDKAIELGVADPKRLAVMGHSYGAYTALSMITYTSRFQAAVALAGFADLVSLYGTFEAESRYREFAHEDELQPALAESGQVRMGAPPWADPRRYERNSPYFLLERVRTPVLLIQGDMDHVALGQAEEFFSGLYRSGKRARFVRYWGEGHIFESPANIVDMWNRIFQWLDEYLAVSVETNAPTH